MENLNEVKLSRVFQHTTNEKIPFAIITAERGENSKDTNIQKNLALAADIRKEGYGYFWLEGHWTENDGKPDERDVVEKSIFIVGNEKDNGKLKGLIKKWVKEYRQEAAVFRGEGESRVGLINNNGSEIKIGTFGTKKDFDKIFSKLKNKQSFVFEKAMLDNGISGRMWNYYKNLQEADRLL